MFRVPKEKIGRLVTDAGDIGGWRSALECVAPDLPLNLETAALLMRAAMSDEAAFVAIIESAGRMRDTVWGRSVKLFVPVYISNACVNECLYCAYRAPNLAMSRRSLDPDEFRREIVEVTSMGYRVIELVTSESPALKENGALARYLSTARDVVECAAGVGKQEAEIILMSWALSEEEFESVRRGGLEAFYLWQETYDEVRFRDLHPQGTPKARFEDRIEVFDRAIGSGIRKVGMGVLFGLSDWRYDVLALISHGRYLEETYGVSPDAIGVPRFKHAEGAPMQVAPCAVSDDELRVAVAIYRLAFPRSHVFLNTREKLPLMLKLLDGGGSEMNIACAVYPGGYTHPSRERQFDHYSYPTEKTLALLAGKGYRPTHYENREAVRH